MERGRYGKTKSAASRALLSAALMLEVRGRPRKLPGKDRPYQAFGAAAVKLSVPAALDRALANDTRTTKAVAIEAFVEAVGKDWPVEYVSKKEAVVLIDSLLYDTREIARYMQRAAKQLAA